ncbi:patatin-like phospholipase RssA [Thiobacter sp. AK1]|uniref:Patatin-like phospholipase RssA n=2 Tax=Thiobacter aerophilum TaxID=3121275 RepID=A0ABV0EFE0_9BURK
MSQSQGPRIGLALGSGSARGWAHVGVIHALEEAGIRPDVVCGTSIGALVGAAYAAGEIERFSNWVQGLRLADVIAFLDVKFFGGLIQGERLMDFFRRNFVDRPVEALAIPFGAVATELASGNEVWLREGSTMDAVRASIALPGLFTPVARDGHLLVDGGLVNPVPVSLARAMGADVVIAVDLLVDVLGRHLRRRRKSAREGEVSAWLTRLQARLSEFIPRNGQTLPSVLDVVASSINIMQVRIARSRMAGEPPDAVVAPRLAHLGLMEFHRGREAIEEGRRAVKAALPQIREALESWG